MTLSYWKKRWQEGNIGWHQEQVDTDLMHFVNNHTLPHPNPVLVPLCGKTMDIDWLVQQKFLVDGVDISSIALQAIMNRHDTSWTQTKLNHAIGWHTQNLTLWQANFFDWANTQHASYGWAWDRAAFVAIKPHLRPAYLQAMAKLLTQPDGWMICKTFEYDASLSTAPPYSITPDDMHTLCKSLFTPTLLQHTTHQMDAGTLHQRGAQKVTTAIWKLSVIASEKKA